MEYLEELGLLKMDFLGLTTLTTIMNIINEMPSIFLSESTAFGFFCLLMCFLIKPPLWIRQSATGIIMAVPVACVI